MSDEKACYDCDAPLTEDDSLTCVAWSLVTVWHCQECQERCMDCMYEIGQEIKAERR